MEYSRRPTKNIPKENQLKILNKIYQTYLVSTTDGILCNWLLALVFEQMIVILINVIVWF